MNSPVLGANIVLLCTGFAWAIWRCVEVPVEAYRRRVRDLPERLSAGLCGWAVVGAGEGGRLTTLRGLITNAIVSTTGAVARLRPRVGMKGTIGATVLMAGLAVSTLAACTPQAAPRSPAPSVTREPSVAPPVEQPAASASVSVRWTEAVAQDDKARADAERDYKLTNPEFREDDARKRTWRYVLTDTSAENIKAIVEDRARVEDTDRIDRQNFTVIR